jgi:DNA-directed DNA polymerase III PolC
MRGLDCPQNLAKRAKKYGYTHIAITDTNGFYGLIEFLTYAKEEGIKPIVGCEFRLHNGHTGLDADVQFVALAKSREGYQALCDILSHTHQNTLNPHLFQSFFKMHAKELVVFSSDLEFLKSIQSYFAPEEVCSKINDQLYFEVAKGFTSFRQIQAAQELGLPLLATTHTHYVEPGRDLEYKLVRAIDKNQTLDEVDIRQEHNFHCYLPTPPEMETWFAHLPQALANTEKVARMCEADWFNTDVVFPHYEGQNENECAQLLREKCLRSISRRYPQRDYDLEKAIHKRLKYELDIIITKGYASYFLVVQDIVEQSHINCGRGSAAASLVSYLLGITHVDPIKHNLFFDRFLNPQRTDPPDIDIDFPWDERDDVIDYVFKKYGDRAAMVANHNYLRGKSAAREVAKVFGIRQDEITYVLDRLPRIKLNAKWENILKLSTRIEGIVRYLSVHCGGVVITPKPIREYVPVEISKKGPPVIQWEKEQTEDAGLVKIDLLGNRSLAVIRDTIETVNNQNNFNQQEVESETHTECRAQTHASGLTLLTPVQEGRDNGKNSRSLQNTQTAYAQTESSHHRALQTREKLYYETLNPIGDSATETSLVAGDTMGVFYIESPATRLFLKKMKSGDFEHIVIAGSIIRPAANRYGNEFVRRLQGGHFRHLHPKLEEILAETFGIMIYQEDVTKVAMAIADFDSFEGNELRKVLGKKHKEKKLAHYKEKFFQGGQRNEVSNSVLVQLWDMILSFAGYSFCKPHSASYALVSMKSCYLKTHYPAEFMAAVISNQGGFYSTNAYVDEARRMGLKILPPDVNYSDIHYTGYTNKGTQNSSHDDSRGFLRVGLMQIKHLSRECIDRIILERQQGRFENFHDFLRRVRPHFNEARLLIMSRALRSLCRHGESLNDLMWELYTHQAKREGLILPETQLPSAACRREYSPGKLVNWEQNLLQGCITFPSWLFFQEYLQQHNIVRGADLRHYIGKEVTLFGKKVTQKQVRTKDHMEMCFTSFSDDVSIYETVFFPNAYAAFRDLLFLGGNFLVKGVVQVEHDDAIQVQITDLKRCEFPDLQEQENEQRRGKVRSTPEHLKIS